MSYQIGENKLRKSIEKGEVAMGLVCHTGSPCLIEMAAWGGFDFVLIDTEHANVNVETAVNLVRTSDAAGIVPLIRVYENSEPLILKALDTGAKGVMIPHINTKEDAERAVRAAKYAPEGVRGVCQNIRAAKYCRRQEWASYWPIANRETIVSILIEEKEGIDNLEEILSVKGIDIVNIGGADLSQSLGIGGQFEHSYVVEAQEKAQALCKQNGLALHFHLPVLNYADRFKEWYDKGVRVFSWPDVPVFYEKCKELIGNCRQVAK